LKRILRVILTLTLKVAPRRGAWIETKKVLTIIIFMVVAPRRGAWIETFNSARMLFTCLVAPRRGAWIETRMSHQVDVNISRTPQGCVD